MKRHMQASYKNEPAEKILRDGAKELGIEPDEKAISALLEYKRILLEWNKKINLTAIEEEREFIVKHFLDSLTILPYLSSVNNIIDVGTGAGFPGLPLKIVRPSLKVTLMDSLEKRVGFLNTVISELKLTSITAIHSRAEDAGASPDHREKYDAATARAVASLPVLLEYCLPFVKTGGIFIAMKGSASDEIKASSKALDLLGGRIEKIENFTLPGSDISRTIIIIKKFRQTPTKYPRKAGKPTKLPLI